MQKGKVHGEGIGLRGRDGMVGKHHRELMELWDRTGREPLPYHTMAKGWCCGGRTQRRRDCALEMETWDHTEQSPQGTGAAAETQMRRILPGTAFY